MEQLENLLKQLADLLWGNWLLGVLLGMGVLYTCITGCVQIRRLPFIIRGFWQSARTRKQKDASGNSLSSLQALFTAVASCVGSGNIVGVSTAILAGGPGALFWMWVAAFFGMATKFGEITLGMCYRGKDRNGMLMGGPMYYIAQAFKTPLAGAVVAVLLFIQNAGATLIQSNTVANVTQEAFGIPPIVTGMITAALLLLVISGGLRRLVGIAERVVPFMAGLYVIGGLLVVFAYIDRLPAMLADIFTSAFSLRAGAGALAGITIREAARFGVARGLYSNEAGEGTATVLHSSAETDHPVRQGLYGVIEVFIDTMVICSTTGFVVLISGVNLTHTKAVTLAAEAFSSVYPLSRHVVNVSLLLFALTSLMSQWYFGHVSLSYLKLARGTVFYRFLFPVLVIAGSLSSIGLVWSIQDCALGLLIIPNLIALLIFAPKVRKLTKEFFDPANGYIFTTKQKGSSL